MCSSRQVIPDPTGRIPSGNASQDGTGFDRDPIKVIWDSPDAPNALPHTVSGTCCFRACRKPWRSGVHLDTAMHGGICTTARCSLLTRTCAWIAGQATTS